MYHIFNWQLKLREDHAAKRENISDRCENENDVAMYENSLCATKSVFKCSITYKFKQTTFH